MRNYGRSAGLAAVRLVFRSRAQAARGAPARKEPPPWLRPRNRFPSELTWSNRLRVGPARRAVPSLRISAAFLPTRPIAHRDCRCFLCLFHLSASFPQKRGIARDYRIFERRAVRVTCRSASGCAPRWLKVRGLPYKKVFSSLRMSAGLLPPLSAGVRCSNSDSFDCRGRCQASHCE